MKRKFGLTFFTLFCLMFIYVASASAHYIWFNANDYTPSVKSRGKFSIGWGHHFYTPVADILTSDKMVDSTFMIGPDGVKQDINRVNIFQFESAELLTRGTYVAVVKRKEGFSTKTKKTYEHKPKNQVTDPVIHSRYLGMYGKAIINAGEPVESDAATKPIGLPLEIVPMVDPSSIGEGDYFTFKLLFKGEPLAEYYNSTYAGFSTDDVWAYSGRSKGKTGIGKVKILKSGVWVIKANHKAPYPNPEEADEYSFTTSLTFEVK